MSFSAFTFTCVEPFHLFYNPNNLFPADLTKRHYFRENQPELFLGIKSNNLLNAFA